MKKKIKLVPKIVGNRSISCADVETIAQMNKKKHKIVVLRKWGGLGDIINTRPLFKTIKTLYPYLHITYAAPVDYHPVLEDSIYIDELINCKTVNLNEYGYKVDISSDCGKYESHRMPFVDKHRSDIWAEVSTGIKLIDHDFHFKLQDSITRECKDILKNTYQYDTDREKKVAIFPKSASQAKDLTDEMIDELVFMVKNAGYHPVIIHNRKTIKNKEVPFIKDITIKQLVHMVPLFDYIITVDTGSFHLCGALEIPTLGIFSWTDAKILGKYHPKFIYVQKHRDDPGGLECVPCWSWPMCKYKQQGQPQLPLKCIRDISVQEIYSKFMDLTNKY